MGRKLEQWLPDAVRQIANRLHDNGFKAWVVGGCVRDSLLAEAGGDFGSPEDWDLATDARPEEVIRLFRRVIPTGLEHGTVTVLIDKQGYEVTTLRGNEIYTDGRRPDSVDFVTDIDADLLRRDFTVNAIAYDPLTGSWRDPFGGMADLKSRVLRAVGDPAARFAEDGLRVLRGARFSATLEFDFEDRTRAAIAPSLASYQRVSAERIRDEWLKTMKARKPSRAFEVMKDEGLLAITAPELMASVGCEQNRYHAFDVWGHTMACLDACPASPVLRMAGLLHDVGKPKSREFNTDKQDYTFHNHELIGADMAAPMLSRLKFSNAERSRIVALVRHHLICYTEDWSDSAVRRWLRRVTPDVAEDLYLLGRADALGKGKPDALSLQRIDQLQQHVERLLAEGAALSTADLAIRGGDLLNELGLRPGPVIGAVLRQLLEEVTDDPSRNERSRLLIRARELAEQTQSSRKLP